MCLSLRDNHTEPYNDSRIRWKVLEFAKDSRCRAYIESLFYPCRWKIGAQKRAKKPLSDHDSNIHVLLHKSDAQHIARFRERVGASNTFGEIKRLLREGSDLSDLACVVVRLEMGGFVASGVWKYAGCCQSEVWRYARITDVFDMRGHNITEEVRKLIKDSHVPRN
jgi:hypothetical protein